MAMKSDLVRESVIRDMSEGVLVLGLDGRIESVNPAALTILGRQADELLGRKIVGVFYEYIENDDFNQAVLDAVYDPSSIHHHLVPYFTGDQTRQLHMMTSYLRNGEEPVGIIVVLADVTELAELKIQYAQQITALLDSLVTALSTAIDERSPYTANHTRNMVKMGEAFLDWLEATNSGRRFDADRRHAFLMSVWLHDVGKLSVPLSVMDKATRLGRNLERVEARFEKLALLDRVSFLEERASREEYEQRVARREKWLAEIHRINTVPFLSDEDRDRVLEIAEARYVDVNGDTKPVLTEAEVKDLLIRKGTLTDDERAIMQGHASATRRILSQVEFPKAFAMVPDWASEHHELLGGGGYPLKMRDDEIPYEVRLLTILDIFEALTARDRPYKKPIPVDRSLGILRDMAAGGSIDPDILSQFEESRAWENAIGD